MEYVISCTYPSMPRPEEQARQAKQKAVCSEFSAWCLRDDKMGEM